jgi:hypothetical protein
VTRKIKIVAVACAIAGAFFFALSTGAPPRPRLPIPNGYDDFLAAARSARAPLMLTGFNVTNFAVAELAVDVASNRYALDLVRSGLAKKCQTWQPDDPRDVFQAIGGFKSLCWLFIERSRVAGETNAAAAMGDCLEAARFESAFAQGGPVISRLVECACQTAVLREAAIYVPRMSPEQSVAAARGFRNIQRDAATWDEIVATDRSWSRGWSKWRTSFHETLAGLLEGKSRAASMAGARARHDAAAAQLTAFIATLDARARDGDLATGTDSRRRP